jgi:hypothetical protein
MPFLLLLKLYTITQTLHKTYDTITSIKKRKGYKMNKFNLSALLLGAALFTGLGVVSASASDMKCGTGKCGSKMEKPAKKCGASMKKAAKKCGASMKSKKCGASMKKAAKKAAKKCGTGKCGSK